MILLTIPVKKTVYNFPRLHSVYFCFLFLLVKIVTENGTQTVRLKYLNSYLTECLADNINFIIAIVLKLPFKTVALLQAILATEH